MQELGKAPLNRGAFPICNEYQLAVIGFAPAAYSEVVPVAVAPEVAAPEVAGLEAVPGTGQAYGTSRSRCGSAASVVSLERLHQELACGTLYTLHRFSSHATAEVPRQPWHCGKQRTKACHLSSAVRAAAPSSWYGKQRTSAQSCWHDLLAAEPTYQYRDTVCSSPCPRVCGLS